MEWSPEEEDALPETSERREKHPAELDEQSYIARDLKSAGLEGIHRVEGVVEDGHKVFTGALNHAVLRPGADRTNDWILAHGELPGPAVGPLEMEHHHHIGRQGTPNPWCRQ